VPPTYGLHDAVIGQEFGHSLVEDTRVTSMLAVRYGGNIMLIAKTPVTLSAKRFNKLRLFSIGLALLCVQPIVYSDEPLGFEELDNLAPATAISSSSDEFDASGGFWTHERFKNALPMPLPQGDVEADTMSSFNIPSYEVGEPRLEPGHPPLIDVAPNWDNRLFELDEDDASQDHMDVLSTEDEMQIEPQEAGAQRAFFSSSKVPADRTGNLIDDAYPYRAIGKLLYEIPGQGVASCTAAVIKPRIVLTAGHCVHSGQPGGWHQNFVFIPAYRDGTAPYSEWHWSNVIVTSAWLNGGGAVPNEADYALILLQDKVINGDRVRIGDIGGWLGLKVNALFPNHVHMIGYPGELDNGEIMHQVASQSFSVSDNNNVLYGSDMKQGSSGGPWIQNFGMPATGQAAGLSPESNAIVGVTSWGPITTPDQMVAASSTLDERLLDMLQQLCGEQEGNC
jgi:V8-like Glu-specific endopeptidase